jgi:phosphohistidine phosphatase
MRCSGTDRRRSRTKSPCGRLSEPRVTFMNASPCGGDLPGASDASHGALVDRTPVALLAPAHGRHTAAWPDTYRVGDETEQSPGTQATTSASMAAVGFHPSDLALSGSRDIPAHSGRRRDPHRSYRGCVKRLYLLRHAKSAWDEPALRDRDRPLAPRGRKASKRMGRWAKKHRIRPQLVVCSTAVRAEQTLKGVLPGLGEPTIWFEVTLYAAEAETLLARVETLPDEVDEAMLVGHNPGLMDLLLLLAAPGELRKRAAVNVPSGALAELEVDIGRWADVSPGKAMLTRFVVPRELG